MRTRPVSWAQGAAQRRVCSAEGLGCEASFQRAGNYNCPSLPLVSHPRCKALVQHYQKGKDVLNLSVRTVKISPAALLQNVPPPLLPQGDFRSHSAPTQHPELIYSPSYTSPAQFVSSAGDDPLSPTENAGVQAVTPLLSWHRSPPGSLPE